MKDKNFWFSNQPRAFVCIKHVDNFFSRNTVTRVMNSLIINAFEKSTFGPFLIYAMAADEHETRIHRVEFLILRKFPYCQAHFLQEGTLELMTNSMSTYHL